MEDIKVEEYVRTRQGIIFQATENIKINVSIPKKYEKFADEITKHSFNIIDLLEVGDYVNGYKVISVDKNVPENCIELDRNNAYEYQFISKKGVQTILTHEQFEANAYKVKGE